jgi:hypothetical protein
MRCTVIPRLAKPLSDTEVRTAKLSSKAYKLTDGGGLYLIVQPIGSKLWQMDYYFAGSRKTLSFGAYPAVGLRKARERRDEARKLLVKTVPTPARSKRRKSKPSMPAPPTASR